MADSYPEIEHKVIDWGPGVYRLQHGETDHRLDDMDVAVSLEESSRYADVPDTDPYSPEQPMGGTVAVLGLHVVEGPGPLTYHGPLQTTYVELTGADCLNLATWLLKALDASLQLSRPGAAHWIISESPDDRTIEDDPADAQRKGA